MLFGLFALSLASFAAAQYNQDVEKLVIHNTGNDDLALYFLGRLNDGDMSSLRDGYETFVGLMAPGASLGRFITFNDTFSLRSGDLKWRLRLTVYAHNLEDYPYKLSFHNIMVGEGADPVELKHHEEGFIWIEPNDEVTHSAKPGHPFVVLDVKKTPRFTAEVFAVRSDELFSENPL